MPQLPPAPGVTRAVLGYMLNGQKCANVLHFSSTDLQTPPDPMALAGRLSDWWINGPKNHTTTDCTLTEVVTTDLSAAGAPSFLHTTGLPVAGTLAGGSAPNNCTVVLSIRTARRGRSYRGRFYWVGLSKGSTNQSNIVAAHLTAMIGYLNDLVVLTGTVGTPDFLLGVLSYYANNQVRATPVFTPATTVVSDGVVDSQRRRLPKRGT